MHHVGSPTNVGEPEMTGATFGGPVNTGEPDVAPDADADHPEIPRSDEPDDAAQLVDNDGGGSAEGGSLDGEVPVPDSKWGSMHQGIDPKSEADRDYDLYVEDLDSDDSEYGSYFCASIATPPVQDLAPTDSYRQSFQQRYIIDRHTCSTGRVLSPWRGQTWRRRCGMACCTKQSSQKTRISRHATLRIRSHRIGFAKNSPN